MLIDSQDQNFQVSYFSSNSLSHCIHCGLCLSSCPTYSITFNEQSSPRGRIRLMKAVGEGKLTINKNFIEEMYFCLDCKACETICPAGFSYGSNIEHARFVINSKNFRWGRVHFLQNSSINWFFKRHSRLKLLSSCIWLFQKTGMIKIIKCLSYARLMPKWVKHLMELMPNFSIHFSSDTLNEYIYPSSFKTHKVVFLTGCIMDVAFPNINIDTVELLKHLNCEVITPKQQGCCGSLHGHNGDLKTARELAIKNIDVFSRYEFDYIVVNSAGCSAFMKKYEALFKQDSEYYKKAIAISKRVKDLSEFISDFNLDLDYKQQTQVFNNKVITYHDACHLIHAQRISAQPRRLIRSISGIDYRELPEASWCCGSAGIYNIINYDDSMKILKRKIENIRSVKPDIIVTGNPGCIIQIEHGLRKENLNIEVLHIATFLRKAYGI